MFFWQEVCIFSFGVLYYEYKSDKFSLEGGVVLSREESEKLLKEKSMFCQRLFEVQGGVEKLLL